MQTPHLSAHLRLTQSQLRSLHDTEGEGIRINLQLHAPAREEVGQENLKDVRVKKFLEKKVWDRMREDEKECPICYDSIRDFKDFCLLRCGHSFHEPCFERYDRKDECPFCRSG